MNADIKKELTAIVGKKRATDNPEDLVAYSYDAFTQEHRPDLVLFPLSTEEVCAVMQIAHREAIPVVVRGSGTNLAGETVPVEGGIVLAMTHMDHILEIDVQNRTATVEPGVINFHLQQAVGREGLMYPPDPASWMVATMGGTVGTNAGGPKTVKYGVTRDYLLGLTIVLADGRVLRTGRTPTSASSGYDLTDLMCGSEGTLGIITQIVVRLIPKPPYTRTLRAQFHRLEDCGRAVSAIMSAGIVPTALELMEKGVGAAVATAGLARLPDDVEAMLLIEVDGDKQPLEEQVVKIESFLRQHHASAVDAAQTQAAADRLWAARRASFSAMARLRPNIITEDATVPVSRLADMIRKVTEVGEKYGLRIGVLAHAGDGNLHPLIVFDKRDAQEVDLVEKATEEIFESALAMGGTLSGEHGIGLAKARFLSHQLAPEALSLTHRIKRAFDPKGILNPGKFASVLPG